MRRLRRLAQLLLKIEDAPERVALAFALGVFIAFFPILGVHTAMALGLALALRLNRIAILAGTFVSNPWTLVPMLTAGTVVGCALLGVSPSGLDELAAGLEGAGFAKRLLARLRPLLLPYLVGNLILGAATGVLAYFVLRSVLKARQH
jgi:hypothetical protein